MSGECNEFEKRRIAKKTTTNDDNDDVDAYNIDEKFY